MEKIAYISVHDKSGMAEFAHGLTGLGYEVWSSGSTLKLLRQAEIDVEEVPDSAPLASEVVKALAGGRAAIEKPYLVVCNLYPIAKIVRQDAFTLEELPDYLDVSNSAVIRAAARSFHDTAVVCDPADYSAVLDALREFGGLPEERLRALAAKAWGYCAYYDATVAQYLSPSAAAALPPELSMALKKVCDLSYGENRHQKAAFYSLSGARPWGLNAATVFQGFPLNLNHYLDLDCAFELAAEFEEPACAVVKHRSPCAAACAVSPAEAFRAAFRADPRGAFGGTAAFNRPVDAEAAQAISGELVESVIAPEYSKEALEILRLREDLRITAMPSALLSAGEAGVHKISGGLLIEESDSVTEPPAPRIVSKRKPSAIEYTSLSLAWRAAKHARTYAIALAQGQATVAIGSGQPSTLDSFRLAAMKAKEKHPIIDPHDPVVLAADAPLPLNTLAEALNFGVKAVMQPGGWVEDAACVELCNSKGAAMVFTGLRHVRH
ncbi:MAG: phosphoribosylaminoimidazolecarboxamide formyltransferase / IMP cyclohydrolase [Elusimicrobia bacterium]|nr:MAG: phosphoribosylaminoimidazolecarboxamide formyltransferase / IMP cyclohydrolase [Elusimicrobiota bacterium]KAF0156431.1 MAG: phosphoribosylaminoimidazolecarboxamide formyltransferase / IMP cyclohydrolase [Elusimicrobiota bacterium]